MPTQLDLLVPVGIQLTPESGRIEPRFWIRRLVIWEKPGIVLREITLRPGLNILWSPDPVDQGLRTESDGVLGHGSGKTLFCRLLRYVLGEDHFAPEGQRRSIAHAFPEGMVGADVVVDGTQWALLRPIGLGRQHFAVPNTSLDQIFGNETAATGIEPFIVALENSILSSDVVALIPVEHRLQAWLIALAWLSRDQECRFDKVLDWRSSDSDSGSPARGLSNVKLLDSLRALIGAIDPAEFKLRAEIVEMDTRQKEVAQDAARRAWEADRLRLRLISELELNPDDLLPGRLAVEPLRQAAKAKLAKLAMVRPDNDIANLAALRVRAEAATQYADSLALERAQTEARIPEIESLIRRIQGERPGASVAVDAAETPLCPVCDVPIDRALAEGCNLSHKLPDLDAAKRRVEKLNEDIATEKGRLLSSRSALDKLTLQLEPARRAAGELNRQIHAVEQAQEARADAWFKTRRLIDDANRLEEYLLSQESVAAVAESLIGEIETKRDLAAAFRVEQAQVFSRISTFFDAVIRELVGPTASGKVSLDGNGLKLSVELGGDRSTAAIDSLKVIAFDLAAMCMSIEGGTHLPAFLVHDSPREADLGLSVYHRLFRLVRGLEREEGQPLFQYIVTTTTRPPEEMSNTPWLRDKLGGAPAEARLLRRNL